MPLRFPPLSLFAGVLALLVQLGLTTSAQELYQSPASQHPVSMAAVHSGDSQPTAKPALPDWFQEGSSSGGLLSRGGHRPAGVTLPSVALLTNANTVSADDHRFQPWELSAAADLQDHMHKLVREVAVSSSSSSRGSTPASTAAPNIGVDSAASETQNPLALLSASGSNRGDALAAQHTDLRDQERSGPQPEPAAGLRLREHAITSRQVRGADEPPTGELVLEVSSGPAGPLQIHLEKTSTESSSTVLGLSSANPTDNQGGLVELNSTTMATDGSSRENSTDGTSAGLWWGNGTTPTWLLLLPNSSSAEAAPGSKGNHSEAASTARGSFLNRQVPATTQDPSTPDNSSGPTFDPPPYPTPICLSRMDIVWIVLAISVPVSTCCKSTQDKQLMHVALSFL